jgi:hypothetical protein
MEPEATLPWWIDGGDLECPFCLQPYCHAAEIRCGCCDAPACPMCAVNTHALDDIDSTDAAGALNGPLCPECAKAPRRQV